MLPRIRPIPGFFVAFIADVYLNGFRQLCGGGGPAGSNLPSASILLGLVVLGRGIGVSGRSRSSRISEGILGAITGTLRGPSRGP